MNALGIGKNDEVIVPNITFLATANSILMTGATPVLVDVNLDDLNININSIKNLFRLKQSKNIYLDNNSSNFEYTLTEFT